MNGASGQNFRAASSRFSVPLAFTVKSVCGSRAAQSCDGCDAVCTMASNAAAMLLEQIQHCVGVANVDVVMFVTANIRNQIVARFPGRSFGAEEFRAHVVVDPDHAHVVAGEALYAFRADQSRQNP